MKKIKRAISLMLVMSMVVSLFAMTGYAASAAERPNSVTYTNGEVEILPSASNKEAYIKSISVPTTLYTSGNTIQSALWDRNNWDSPSDIYDVKTDLNTTITITVADGVTVADVKASQGNITKISGSGNTYSYQISGTANNTDVTYEITYTANGKTYTTFAASYVKDVGAYLIAWAINHQRRYKPTFGSTGYTAMNHRSTQNIGAFYAVDGIDAVSYAAYYGNISGSYYNNDTWTPSYGYRNGKLYTDNGTTEVNINNLSWGNTAYANNRWAAIFKPNSAYLAFMPAAYRSGSGMKRFYGYYRQEKDTDGTGGEYLGATIYYDNSLKYSAINMPYTIRFYAGQHGKGINIPSATNYHSAWKLSTPFNGGADTNADNHWDYQGKQTDQWYTTTAYSNGAGNGKIETKNTDLIRLSWQKETTLGQTSSTYNDMFTKDTYKVGKTSLSNTNDTADIILNNPMAYNFWMNFSPNVFDGTKASYRYIQRYESNNINNFEITHMFAWGYDFVPVDRSTSHSIINKALEKNYETATLSNDQKTVIQNALRTVYTNIGNLSGAEASAKIWCVNTSNIKDLINYAPKACADCGLAGEKYYTADSWNAYQTALNNAKSLAAECDGTAWLDSEKANATAKQDELNPAGSALANAINALEIGEAAHEPYHNETPTVSSKANGTEANSALNAIITEKNLGGTAYASAAKASPAFVETAKGDETANSNVYLYTNDSVNTMYIVEASASLAKPVTISIRARSKHGTPYYYAAAGAKVSATSASTSTASDFVILNPTFKDNTSGPDSEMKRSFVEYQIIATGANGKQETYSVTFAYYNDDNNGTKLGVTYTDGNKWTSNGFGIRRVHDNAVRWWEFVGKDDARAYDKDFGSSAYGSFALKVSGYNTAAEVTAAIKSGSLSTAGAIVYGGNKTDSNVPVHDDYYFKADDAKSGDQYYVHLVDRFGNTCSELITIEKTDSTEPTVQSNGSSATVSDKGGSMIESLELTSNGEAYNGWTLSEDNNAVGNNTLSLSNLAPNATYSLTATDAAGNASTASLTADDNGNAKITVNNFSDLRYLEKDNYKVNRKTGEDKSVATVLLNGETVTINNNVTVSLWQRIIRALADFFNSLLGFKVA